MIPVFKLRFGHTFMRNALFGRRSCEHSLRNYWYAGCVEPHRVYQRRDRACSLWRR